MCKIFCIRNLFAVDEIYNIFLVIDSEILELADIGHKKKMCRMHGDPMSHEISKFQINFSQNLRTYVDHVKMVDKNVNSS